MFDNIGGKLKLIAKLLTALGIGTGLFAGIFLTVTDRILLWQGIAILIGIPFAAWIVSAFVYGFGELIERTAEIAYNTRDTDSPLPPHLTNVRVSRRKKREVLEDWLGHGLITKEEYTKKYTEMKE